MSGPLTEIIETAINARRHANLRYRIPAKHPPRGKHWSDLWTEYSPKLFRVVHMYSTIEYDNWIRVEANRMIRSFCEQPIWMIGELNGKIRRSLIDLWVWWVDNHEEYWEIKYADEMASIDANEDLRVQIFIQKQWCANNGAPHLVKKEDEVYSNCQLLKNWGQVLQVLTLYKDMPLMREMVEVMTLITIEESETLRNVMLRLNKFPLQSILAATYRLIHLGLLDFVDESSPLTKNSRVKMSATADLRG